jgi:hypothetical protein
VAHQLAAAGESWRESNLRKYEMQPASAENGGGGGGISERRVMAYGGAAIVAQ